MPTVTSKDGTAIAYDRSGDGSALILVDGALCSRSFGPMGPLAAQLTPHFTVYTYDRRGRGESGDTQPFAVEREIEDIEALVNVAGRSAFVYGISSGAALAFEAARLLPTKITKLALYEPPYTLDPEGIRRFKEYRTQLGELLAAGRKGDAIELFMRLVGAGDEGVAQMRQAPIWPLFEAVAPTLAYDAAALGDSSVPTERTVSVTIPALVMAGGATFPFIRQAAQALTGALPHAQYRELEGQTHEVAAEALAPVLTEFFGR
jgi:pimeloyl-ACP methyl ester carboxylesterase